MRMALKGPSFQPLYEEEENGSTVSMLVNGDLSLRTARVRRDAVSFYVDGKLESRRKRKNGMVYEAIQAASALMFLLMLEESEK